MSHAPKTYVRITVDFGSGEHSLNHDMDGAKITEAEVARVFDRSKWAAVEFLRRTHEARPDTAAGPVPVSVRVVA